MTLQPISAEFPYIWGKFSFLFYQCGILGEYIRQKISLNTFFVFGDDFVYRKQPKHCRLLFNIFRVFEYGSIPSAYSPQMFKYFPRILRICRKKFLLSTRPDEDNRNNFGPIQIFFEILDLRHPKYVWMIKQPSHAAVPLNLLFQG